MSIDTGGGDEAHLRGAGEVELGGVHEEVAQSGGRRWEQGGASIKLVGGFYTGPAAHAERNATDEDGVLLPVHERFSPDDINAMNATHLCEARNCVAGDTASVRARFNDSYSDKIEEIYASFNPEEQDTIKAKLKISVQNFYPDFANGEIPDCYVEGDSKTGPAYDALKNCIDAIRQEVILEYAADNDLDIENLEEVQALANKNVNQLDTLALIEKSEVDQFLFYENYSRDKGFGDEAISELSFKEVFLNSEDIDKATKMMAYFDACIDKYMDVVEKSPQELALAKLPDVKDFNQLKLELYKNFYINSDTGRGWQDVDGLPRRDAVNKWIEKTLEKDAKESFSGTVSTPLQRRNAAVFSMYEKMSILESLDQVVKQKTLVFDEGNLAIVGFGQSYKGDNLSEVMVSQDGVVSYREKSTRFEEASGFFQRVGLSSRKPIIEDTKILKPEDGEVSLGDGVTISVSEGGRPILKFNGDLKHPPISKPKIYEKELDEGTRRGKLYCKIKADGTDLPVEEYICRTPRFDIDLLRDQIVGVQGYAHHYFDGSIASQRKWANYSTREELVVDDKRVRIGQNEARQEQIEYIKSDLEKLGLAHGRSIPPEIDRIAFLATIGESQIQKATNDNVFEKDAIEKLKGMKDTLKSVAGSFFERVNNEEKIAELEEGIKKLNLQLHPTEGPKPAENEAVELEIAIAKLEKDILWFKRDSSIALMESCIEAIAINSNDEEVKRPDGWADNQEVLEEAFQSLGEQLFRLEKEGKENDQKLSNLERSIEDRSPINLSALAGAAVSHVKSVATRQTTLEDLSRRKYLASIGYDMGSELKNMFNGLTGLQAEGLTGVIRNKATRLAEVLRDNPEMGALIVSDISQVKGVLSGESVLTQLQDRLKTHTLTKAFLEGVPEGASKDVDISTVKELQAISDFLRIAVPLSGFARGAATQTDWVSSFANKVPYVGGALSMVTGALYGAVSAEVVRSSVTNLSDETRAQAYAVANAISEGSPKGYLEAHAKIDAAKITGELSKALTDKGSFTKNLIFRAARSAKHFITEKWGAMAKLLTSSQSSIGEKVIAFVGIVAPVAGVAVGALAIAGVIASGPFLPLAAVLIGSLFAISSYAKTKDDVNKYLNEKKKEDAKSLEKQFESNPTEKAKQIKAKYKKGAKEAVLKAHSRGLYDAELRKAVKDFNAEKEDKKRAAIEEHCKSNGRDFEKYLKQRQVEAKKHYETLSIDSVKIEFHQKGLIQKKMNEFVEEMYQKTIERASQESLGVSFKDEVEAINPLAKDPVRPEGINKAAFNEVFDDLKKREVKMDELRFPGVDLTEQAARAA